MLFFFARSASESKQADVWCRQEEECAHNYDDVCGEFERTGDMVDSLRGLAAHDVWIRGERF